MQRNYPHINDTAYPDLNNINVWKWENVFDFSRWDEGTKLYLCSVRWDSNYSDVPLFKSSEEKNEFFKSLDSQMIVLDTAYRLVRDEYVKIYIPYDVAIRYNYLVAELPVSTSASQMLDGERIDGIRRYYYFIEDVEYSSPSTTLLNITFDYWTMFCDELRFKNAFVERGHYGIAKSSVQKYLNNPIVNSEYLLAEDVDFNNGAYSVKSQNAVILNEENIRAVIVTTANIFGDFGEPHTNSWTSNGGNYIQDGALTLCAFSLDVNDLTDFIANANRLIPQLFESVKGIYFISADYISVGNDFSFCGINCAMVQQKNSAKLLFNLTKEKFGYRSEYADLAKLYTYPYSWIEVADSDGNTATFSIENTIGELTLDVTSQLVFPWLSLDTHILGFGNITQNYTFKNITSETFKGGDWYEYVKRFDIPCFEVVQANSIYYDYATHFDRKQQMLQNETAKINADGSATVAKINADASATTGKTNSDESATTAKTNSDESAATAKTNSDASATTAKTNSDANANTARANTQTNSDTTKANFDRTQSLEVTLKNDKQENRVEITKQQNAQLQNMTEFDNLASQQITALGNMQSIALTNNSNQAAIANTTVDAIAGVATGALEGAASGGGAGAAAGAAGGVISAIPSAIHTGINVTASSAATAISVSSEDSINQVIRDNNSKKTSRAALGTVAINSMTTVYENATLQHSQATALQNTTASIAATNAIADRNLQNALAANKRTYDTTLDNNKRTYDTSTANNQRVYNTSIANNKRTYDTAMANNQRNYDNSLAVNALNKQTADEGVANAIRQAGLKPAREFGQFANGDTVATRPIGVFALVKTQNDDSIRQTGDYFLKYGYALNRYVPIESAADLCPMEKFTYWKMQDIYIENQNEFGNAIEGLIGEIFKSGVTVWKNASEIGKVSIYDNK